MVAPEYVPAASGQVVSLLDALRASLEAKKDADGEVMRVLKKPKPLPEDRKPARRVPN